MHTRALAPDVARGLALCFIAIANVMLYLHDRRYGMRQRIVEEGAVDTATTFSTVALVDGRVYPLFALLLGYGVARSGARDSGAAGTRRLRRRGLGLVLFGAVHGVLLFSGDILGLYGILTILLIRALRWSDRRLLVVAAVLIVPCALVQGIAFAEPGPTLQRAVLWSIGIDSVWEALAWRPLEWVMGMAGMLGVIPAALVGIWAGRRDLVADPASHRSLLTRLGVCGIAVGVLGGTPAAAIACGLVTVEPGPIPVVLSTLHVATGVIGGIGGAALVALACADARVLRRRLTRTLSAVGERSLTCYLLQSVLMVPLLAAWALGGGGWLSSVGALLFGLAVYASTACVALWLARLGTRGPAEHLLRRFADGGAPLTVTTK